MQLRNGKTKSTATLNEAAVSNAPEGANKKDKSLKFMKKDEITTNVLSTQATRYKIQNFTGTSWLADFKLR